MSVTELWPFECRMPAPAASASARDVARAALGSPCPRDGLVYDTARHLWSQQQSMGLSKPVASALLQTGLGLIEATGASPSSSPWVTLVLAQQASLDGRFDASLGLSLEAVATQRQDAALTPHVALGCALMGLFHRGLLKACPLTLDTHGRHAQLDRRVVYAEALGPLFALQAELRGLKSPRMPARLHAQVDRIHVVLDTLAGVEPSQASRLQLLADGSGRPNTTHVGQALLCSGLAHRFRDDGVRATRCFEELAALSARLGWGLGRWVALWELGMLRASSTGGLPPSPAAIGAMIGPDFSSWLLQPRASLADASVQAPRNRVEKAKALIQEALGQRLSVADVASQCEVSPRTLGQDFKDLEGMTPLEYITRQRVALAEQLLTQHPLHLKTVANAVGFDSVLGFSKAYARVTGRAPVLHAASWSGRLAKSEAGHRTPEKGKSLSEEVTQALRAPTDAVGRLGGGAGGN